MIMAGRGKRLLLEKDESKNVGTPKLSLDNSSSDLPSLIKKINEISVSNINPTLLIDIQNIIKQLFKSKDIMKEILSELHKKALDDFEFGENVVIALEQVSNMEIDGTVLRGELLSFIQSDFKVKEVTFESDSKTFVNSVIFLGHIYNRFKVCGEPIVILGVALYEYFDLLIKGQEEELRTLTKQIILNGTKLKNSDKYETLKQNLRNTLITKDLNSLSKCWILLTIDLMSNGLKPLNGIIRDFYLKNLGEEFTKLEALTMIQNDQIVTSSPASPDSTKSQDNVSPKSKSMHSDMNKTSVVKKDLPKKFSDMSIKPNSDKKSKVQFGKNNKDIWKSGTSVKGTSGHDDRFEKEENYYGAQKPRQPKPESQKKKLNDAGGSKQEFDNFKTDSTRSSQPESENKNYHN